MVFNSTFRFVPEPCAALDATCDDETFAADDETLVGTWEDCADDPGGTAGKFVDDVPEESWIPEDGELVVVWWCDSCDVSVLSKPIEPS